MKWWLGLLLVLAISGCQNVPTPARYHWPEFEKVEPVGKLEKVEGDEKVVPVKVGELRNALYVADAYDALVERRNREAEIAMEAVAMGKSLEKDNKSLREQSRYLQFGILAVGMFALGMTGAVLVGR